MNYTGLECPVCGKAFTEQDDIVVCPECGAPHHRECYTAHGRCGCAETHGTDQQWDRCHHAVKKNCPFCQGQNDEDASFCSHCGRPLTEPNTQQQQTPPGGAPRDPGAPYGPGVPFGPAGQPFPQRPDRGRNLRRYGKGGAEQRSVLYAGILSDEKLQPKALQLCCVFVWTGMVLIP